MQPLYQLDSLRKCHGDHIALDLQQLSIEAGSLTVLNGPNGAGKSTLLSLLAFLSIPTSGQIRFEGSVVDFRRGNVFELRRQVTLLHQSPYLFKGTVVDNVTFGLRMRGFSKDEQRRLVMPALTMVGLPDFGGRMAHMLSGGEAQRVALARALVMCPRVLLLDEPFAGVDGETAATMENVLCSLVRKGVTVVLSSHDPSVAVRLDGRIIRLVAGKVAEPGKIHENTGRLYATV